MPKSKPKKRKVEKTKGDDENETPAKRERKYRHRDKTKDNRTIFIGNCSLSTDKKVNSILLYLMTCISALIVCCLFADI